MKKFLSLVVALLLLTPFTANAYNSAEALDPNVTVPASGGTFPGSYDAEYKSVVRSNTAGFNDALSAGQALYYSQQAGEIAGLEMVSGDAPGAAVGTGSDTFTAAAAFQACVVPVAVATGFNAAFRCQTRGYATALFDFSGFANDGRTVAAGSELCISSQASAYGRLVPCSTSVRSRIISVESKVLGVAKGSIKVRLSSD